MDDLTIDFCGICLVRGVKKRVIGGAVLWSPTCGHPECEAEYEMVMSDYPEELGEDYVVQTQDNGQ